MAEDTSGDAAVPALATRLGLPLVSPRGAFAMAEAAGGRAGLSDAATLLLLKFLCVEAKALVAAVWTMLAVGFGAGFASIGPRLQAAIGLDLLLLAGGGVFVTLAAGRRRRAGRDFDLAATAWVPYFVLSVVASFVVAVLGLALPRQVTDLLGLAGLGLYAGFLGLAVRHARQRPASAERA